MTTPNLLLSEYPAGSLTPSVPFNDDMQALDALVQLAVEDKDMATPPTTVLADVGKRWIIPSGATGAWSGRAGQVALCTAADTWRYFTPVEGWRCDVRDEDIAYRYSGAEWTAESGGGGATSLGWFNVLDHGAAGDGVTDDTAAIQAAIDAAEAAGGGVVYFPAGVYVVGGALQDTSRSNAQLLLPRRDALDVEQITIELRGEAPPPPIVSVVGATAVPDNLSVIKGTLNAGTGSLIGTHGPVGTFEDFTFLFLRVENMTFRLPSNPVLTACDFSKVCGVDLDNVVVDCGSYHVEGLTEPTTATSYGIRCPANNNGAYTRLGAVNVIGFYKGYEFAEHSVGQQVAAWGCKQAFVFASALNHASHFQRLMAVHCERGIVATGTHYVDIEQYDTEHAAAGWWVTDFDVDDANHYLSGRLRWHVVLAGVGVDSTFTVNGAAKLGMHRMGLNGIPTYSLSAATTLAAQHANACVLHPSADTTARTFTIPANAATPYPIGTAITFVNQDAAGVVTIAITTDTMRLAGAGTTGSRTLAANGMATAVKITATEWIISGTGLT